MSLALQAAARSGDLFACHQYYFGNEPWDLHRDVFHYLRTGVDPRLELPPDPSEDRFVGIPPGFGKSTIILTAVVMAVAFDRNFRWIIGSKASKRATVMAREARQHFEYNPRLIQDFGPFRGTKWTEAEFQVCGRDPSVSHPTVRAIGIDTATLGSRADGFVGDDLLDPSNTKTEYRRAQFTDWISKVALSRLDPSRGRPWPYGCANHVGNLLHRRDWNNVQITEGRIVPFLRKAYWDDERTIPTLPEFFGHQALEKVMGRIPHSIFEVLFMLNLRGAEGAVFHQDWVRFYADTPERVDPLDKHFILIPPRHELQVLQGWDLAGGEDQAKGDFIVGATVGRHITTGRHFVLDVYRERADVFVQLPKIIELGRRWDPLRINIEKNFGQAVAKFATTDPAIGARINPVHSSMNKTERVRWGLQSLVQRGDLFWPEARLIDERDEFFDFPAGDHDDVADAIEIALRETVETTTARDSVLLDESRII